MLQKFFKKNFLQSKHGLYLAARKRTSKRATPIGEILGHSRYASLLVIFSLSASHGPTHFLFLSSPLRLFQLCIPQPTPTRPPIPTSERHNPTAPLAARPTTHERALRAFGNSEAAVRWEEENRTAARRHGRVLPLPAGGLRAGGGALDAPLPVPGDGG